MDPFRRFKLEAAVVVGLAILIARMAPRLADAPRSVRWTHFSIVGIYSLVGIAGVRFLLMFCLGHQRFVEAFTHPNVIGFDAGLMQVVAVIFSLAGAVLFVAAMLLGELNRKAYRIIRFLLIPCGFPYPLVMVNVAGTVGSLPSTVLVAQIAAFAFVPLGYLTLLFYSCKFDEFEAALRRGSA